LVVNTLRWKAIRGGLPGVEAVALL
jgi:hypothetical protein